MISKKIDVNILEENNIYNIKNKFLYRDIVLLYCPIKVGSTSIASSIRMSASDKFIVFHSHDEVIFTAGEKKVLYSDIIKNIGIKNINSGKSRKIYVIDVYRSPIERKISEYFQYISEYHFNNTEENIVDYNFEKILKRFNDVYHHLNNIDYYNDKFGVELIKEFDFKKKFHKYEKDGVVYIKLRLKDSEYWGEILSEILETPIKLIRDYDTKDKKIGLLYKKFVNEYRLPSNYFNNIICCPQLRKYYTEEDRIKYLEEWKKKLSNIHHGYNLEQFIFYKTLCNENKFYKNSNDHYSDDGCLCIKCKKKREIILKNIDHKNIKIKVKHNLDDNYNSALIVRLFDKNNNYTDILINYYNFY